MQDGTQQPEAVILPLLVRAIGVDQVTQIAEVEPENIARALVPFSAQKVPHHPNILYI